MIELVNVTKTFEDSKTTVFKNISAKINDGDVVSIIGPSGTGKSTLLFCINMLSPPTSGKVLLDGVNLADKNCDINFQRQKLGMVFQHFNLFENMNVLENVINPQITLLHRTKQEACDKAMQYLKMVGMAEKIYSYPDSLSGGQKQRVAIARTLAMDPEVILLDEPTSALDPTMVGEVEYVIKKLASEGRTMMIVTHEMRFAREVSNRVFYLDEKGIYEEGPTEEIFTNPKKEKTRRFINRIKSVEIRIESEKADYIGAIKDIEVFGDKLALSPNTIKKAELLFEEFCIEKLLPKLLPNPHIRAVFEYSEKENMLLLTVFHNGERILLKLDSNDPSKRIIDSLSNEIKLFEEIEEKNEN